MSFSVDYVYQIIDRFSGPLKKINNSTYRFKRGMVQARKEAARLDQKLEGLRQRSDQLRGSLFDGLALGYAFSIPIKKAVEFEAAMADVRKVVDFAEPDGLKKMSKQVLEMSRTIPISAKGIADIVAAGGQLGVAEKDLPDFAKTAAKMSIAFDMLPSEAGDAMAKLSNIFGIPVNEIEGLGDAINHLSNDSATKAEEIVIALKNKGAAAGQAMNLTANDTVALTSTFISLGINADRVGSVMDSMARKFNDQTKVGKKFVDLFQKDGKKALVEYFKAAQKLKGADRIQFLNKVFSEFGIRMDLLSDKLPELERQLGLVANKSRFAGSMQDEYNARIETAEAKIQLFKNAIDRISIIFGGSFLPVLTAVIGAIGLMIEPVAWLGQEFPFVTSVIMAAIGALIALRISTIAFMFASNQMVIALTLAKKIFLVNIWAMAAYRKAVALMVAAKTAAIPLINAFWIAVKGPIGKIIALVGVLAAGGYQLYKHWEPFRNIVDSIWDKVKGIVRFVGKRLGINVSSEETLNTSGSLEGAAATSSETASQKVATPDHKLKASGRIEVVAAEGAAIKSANFSLNEGANIAGAR